MVEEESSGLRQKVDFLLRPDVYPHSPPDVSARETHMSWVFLAGERVYKLKKPVRFPYLDFSTLTARENACRAELALNRRLAPTVYLDVVPLRRGGEGLSFASGAIVDWLVLMRRLDESLMLDSLIKARAVPAAELDKFAAVLTAFYKRARRPRIDPATYLNRQIRAIAFNAHVLLHPHFGLPTGVILRVAEAQRRFIRKAGDLVLRRIRDGRILDGHGDLRPEHIWLGQPLQIIDCLEFNPELRHLDSLDELAYFSVECERLGAAAVGTHVVRRVAHGLHEELAPPLFAFYRCCRATMRARLAIAHLLDPQPRTPSKWPTQARAYLAIAEREARFLQAFVRSRRDRPACASRARGAPLRRTILLPGVQ
jgi:aminoglycoside phosphotransferase family enzyme